MTYQLSPLSYDYVFNYVFKKLGDTFDKYRGVLPIIEDVEQAIVSREVNDPFQITMSVIEMLKCHAEKSELVNEVYENVKRDFWHALKPDQISKHEGQYYISSAADKGLNQSFSA